MNIFYKVDGKKHTLTLGEDGKWSGDQLILAAQLNDRRGFVDFLGHVGYYRHPWDRARAVADKLGGTLDAAEPVESDFGDKNILY